MESSGGVTSTGKGDNEVIEELAIGFNAVRLNLGPELMEGGRIGAAGGADDGLDNEAVIVVVGREAMAAHTGE